MSSFVANVSWIEAKFGLNLVKRCQNLEMVFISENILKVFVFAASKWQAILAYLQHTISKRQVFKRNFYFETKIYSYIWLNLAAFKAHDVIKATQDFCRKRWIEQSKISK